MSRIQSHLDVFGGSFHPLVHHSDSQMEGELTEVMRIRSMVRVRGTETVLALVNIGGAILNLVEWIRAEILELNQPARAILKIDRYIRDAMPCKRFWNHLA